MSWPTTHIARRRPVRSELLRLLIFTSVSRRRAQPADYGWAQPVDSWWCAAHSTARVFLPGSVRPRRSGTGGTARVGFKR